MWIRLSCLLPVVTVTPAFTAGDWVWTGNLPLMVRDALAPASGAAPCGVFVQPSDRESAEEVSRAP
jgi:hypothetical protein